MCTTKSKSGDGLRGDTDASHIFGKSGLRDGDAVLNEHLRLIEIGPSLKVIVSVIAPWLVLWSTYRAFSTPSTSCSMGVATVAAITCGRRRDKRHHDDRGDVSRDTANREGLLGDRSHVPAQ